MDYQELYSKYQEAIKLRELSVDNNYKLLKDIFVDKMLSNLTFSAPNNIIPYLAGIRDVFNHVEHEADKVKVYRDQLDKHFAEKNM